MDATVIKFDALPDAVRAAAKNHDLGIVGRLGFALFLITRVQVRRGRRKLCCTCINAFEYRTHPQVETSAAYGLVISASKFCDTRIREPLALDRPHHVRVDTGQPGFTNIGLDIYQVRNLHKEPAVDSGYLCDIFVRVAVT